MRVIIPGSYDPVTIGHVDLIRRAAKAYDEVYVVIFQNAEKTYTYSLEDRVRMLMLATDSFDNVLVSYSLGYVVDYMREHDIDLIVKGYRDDEDFAYECMQAKYNKAHGGYNTLLLHASEGMTHIRSTAARDALAKQEDVTDLLPACVIEYLQGQHRDSGHST